MTASGSTQTAATAEPAQARERERAHEALTRLARPRLTGSAGAAETDTYLKGEFERLGYEVHELPFSFSALPGRFGLSVAGLVVLLAGTGAAALAGLHEGAAALVLLAGGGLLLGAGAYNARRAIARLPIGRMQGANWLVTRPGARPRYLVAAHRDSKSQGVPLLLRAAAIAVVLAAALALLLLCLVSYFGSATWQLGAAAWAIGLLCAAAGVVLMLSFVRNESPGALDNASGVAALLGLAAGEGDDVGFLLTDAEELGLAGASAVCSRLPSLFGIINVDGVDDAGDFQVVERYGLPRRGLAPQLVAALLGGAHALGLPAERRALPIGVLVDHIPFADAGIPAVTLMRGTSASLRRVHLPQDDVTRLTGAGVVQAVTLLAAALALLRPGAGSV